ncbi:MAG: SpoIIE family protein phosphatase [Flavobacteriales bacterium]|nr:SpoIIE family protein phosphatase [Flavobacteriales bacterium]
MELAEIELLKTENDLLKKELKMVKAELVQLKTQLQEEHNMLMESKKDLTDSITYAKRIQQAIMAPISAVEDLMGDGFVLYLPKDIVAGDFYFVEEKGSTIFFSAVDCTGHGVPGALMSVVGFNYLHQAIMEKNIHEPNEILSYLDEGVNDRLRQTGGESGIKDGMDLGLCSYDTETRILQYAGAYNPLYLVTKDGLQETKADKLPIGMNDDGVVDIYTNHTFQLEKGDCVYLFSDGYADQFGGPRGKKYKYKQLRETLEELYHLPMQEQKQELINRFEAWRGDEAQIDDVLIMGLRV